MDEQKKETVVFISKSDSHSAWDKYINGRISGCANADEKAKWEEIRLSHHAEIDAEPGAGWRVSAKVVPNA